jgi:hypothetical protein
MNKNSAVNYRMHFAHKESLQEWADREGITLSRLLVILTTCKGPPALVNKILVEHITKMFTSLGLPDQAFVLMLQDKGLTDVVGRHRGILAELEMAERIGDIKGSEMLTEALPSGESRIYREFAAAIERYFKEEVVEGNHVSDND